jgi:hypothetical protein
VDEDRLVGHGGLRSRLVWRMMLPLRCRRHLI